MEKSTNRVRVRGRGRGRSRGQPAHARADAVAPICSTAATLNPFFSRPPLSGAPHCALVVDATGTFSCRCSALVSTLKPCHLCSIHFWCSSRQEHAFLFPFCVRKVPGYCALVSGKFSFFALHCALNSEVCFPFCFRTTAVDLGLLPFTCLHSL